MEKDLDITLQLFNNDIRRHVNELNEQVQELTTIFPPINP